jgi:hypothetical protein
MTEETNNSGPQRPDLSVIRGQLRDAGQPDRRVRIDVGNADLEAMMRIMIPVMAQSETFFNFSGGLYIIDTIEAPPRIATYGDEDEDVVIEPLKMTVPVTTADLLVTGEGVADEDQMVLLNELRRFLTHESAGVQGFDRMPKEWT